MVPAILRLMGRATHWIPKWLNKILPHVDIEGEKLLEKTAEADAPAKAPGA
jgi:RND superfamily putative drug exporter